jgi:hypothetical protein
MGMEVMVLVLFIAGVLTVNIILAAVFGNLASKKGHSRAAYGTLVFFFGLIGMIVVIALPDRASAASGQPTAAYAVIPAGLPDPRSPSTQGRYERLSAEGRTFYASGSPVLMAASALLKDTQTGTVIAQAVFRNIMNQPLSAVVVNVEAKDIVGEQLQGIANFQYLDLNTTRGVEFGSATPIYLPDARTRGFTIVVRRVVFTDGSFWEAPAGLRWYPAPRQQVLQDVLGDEGLVRQYQRDTSARARFVPVSLSDLWFCSCGEVNHTDESACHSCGLRVKQATKALDRAGLEQRLTGWEQQAKQEQERRLKRIVKKASIAVASAAVVTVVALAVFYGAIEPMMEQAERQRRLDAERQARELFLNVERQVLESCSVGDVIRFGDIDWQVLDVRDGRVLLIAQDTLEERPYHDEETDVTWEICSLRAYLNDVFLREHFSEEEQRWIVLSSIVNDDNPAYGTPGGNDTQDRVFLLSIDEARRYFPVDITREPDSYNLWWLRSPGGSPTRAAYADPVYSDFLPGDSVLHEYGTRPALWLDLNQ